MMAGGIPLDPDAVAFLTAAGITDGTITSAINNLVVSLKGFGLWTKLKAIYPFVGGTATTHKFNLKDPQDTNAAFRLVFAGGWTHSANGAQPNGTNAYADTFFVPNTHQSITSGHISAYSRTSATSLTTFGLSIGASNNSTQTSYLTIRRNFTPSSVGVMWGELSNDFVAASNADGKGFYILTRTSSSLLQFFKSGTLLAQTAGAQTQTQVVNFSYYLATINAANSPGVLTYDNKEFAFVSMGDGINTTQSLDLQTAVQAFQTTLGRQV